MQWRMYARPPSFAWFGLITVLLCCVGGPLMVVAGSPLASVTFFAFGLMGFPLCVPARLRAEVGKDAVRLRPPPLYRNPLLWLPVSFGLMGVSGIGTSLVDDDEDSIRILVYGIVLSVIAVYLAIYAFRVRGAVDLSAQWVTFVHGKRYSITDDTFGLHVPRRGAPSVKFVHAADPGRRASFMPSKIYGFDINSMLSTFEQLRVWAGEGRLVTPAHIRAMLDVEPPTGVEVGASVEVPVLVSGPDTVIVRRRRSS